MTMPSVRSLWGMAFALSLGAAISLGMARFSYGMLLPPMREDLAWSYTLAGAMNTANALGYLLGAMSLPRMLRRWDAVQVFMAGAVLTSVFLSRCFRSPESHSPVPTIAERVRYVPRIPTASPETATSPLGRLATGSSRWAAVHAVTNAWTAREP